MSPRFLQQNVAGSDSGGKLIRLRARLHAPGLVPACGMAAHTTHIISAPGKSARQNNSTPDSTWRADAEIKDFSPRNMSNSASHRQKSDSFSPRAIGEMTGLRPMERLCRRSSPNAVVGPACVVIVIEKSLAPCDRIAASSTVCHRGHSSRSSAGVPGQIVGCLRRPHCFAELFRDVHHDQENSDKRVGQ